MPLGQCQVIAVPRPAGPWRLPRGTSVSGRNRGTTRPNAGPAVEHHSDVGTRGTLSQLYAARAHDGRNRRAVVSVIYKSSLMRLSYD